MEKGETVVDDFIPDKLDALQAERMTTADDVIREYNRGILDRDPMDSQVINPEIEELIDERNRLDMIRTGRSGDDMGIDENWIRLSN